MKRMEAKKYSTNKGVEVYGYGWEFDFDNDFKGGDKVMVCGVGYGISYEYADTSRIAFESHFTKKRRCLTRSAWALLTGIPSTVRQLNHALCQLQDLVPMVRLQLTNLTAADFESDEFSDFSTWGYIIRALLHAPIFN